LLSEGTRQMRNSIKPENSQKTSKLQNSKPNQ
jgi:hypothetical protein